MVRVAFQGERGAYSELATAMLWPGARSVPCRANADVVRAVAGEEVDAGVLAIENSIAGTVTATLDALLETTEVYIVAETLVPIHHCLLALPGTVLSEIRWVESHPVALAQCGKFFAHHPALSPRPVYDTAGAAREVAAGGDPTRAALASRTAADVYGLSVLLERVEDRPDNRTRFIGVSRSRYRQQGGGQSRTSLALAIDDRPGALAHLLTPIANLGMNISRLEARPAGEPWTQRFVIEILHRGDDLRLQNLVAELQGISRSCRTLGTYPIAMSGW